AMVTMTTSDDLTRYMQEQDRLFAEMESELVTLGKLLSGEELGLIEQLRPLLDDYRRRNTQLRKLVTIGASDHAINSFLGDHAVYADKLREVLRHSVEQLEQQPQAVRQVQELHIVFATLNDLLGQMVLETNDTKMTEMSHRVAALFDKLTEHLLALQDAGP